MPMNPSWHDITIRLALATLTGLLIGFNRSEHGRPAGMRTTLIVCLTATIAVILGSRVFNPLAATSTGLDPLRLAPGILSGMGFIGAGAIIRRESVVVGLTTAATLWYVTLIGLCFGAGELSVGLVALGLGFLILWGLKWAELRVVQDCRATLSVTTKAPGLSQIELRDKILASGYRIASWGISYFDMGHTEKLSCELEWRARPDRDPPPEFLAELARHPGVIELQWCPAGGPAAPRL
jgi:putative Mg2+ transporter-C (MgtC) family protein